MPRSSDRTFHRLRTNSPAPTSRTTESAACATVSTSRNPARCEPPSRTPDLRSAVTSGRLACSAGASPTIRPVASATIADSARTCPSTGDDVHSTSGKRTPRTSWPVPYATTRPASPPAAASRTLSVSSRRMRRPRAAPSVRRTATSRRRRTDRASNRFTTLAQAISRTATATPTSQRATETSIDSLPLRLKVSGRTVIAAVAVAESVPL